MEDREGDGVKIFRTGYTESKRDISQTMGNMKHYRNRKKNKIHLFKVWSDPCCFMDEKPGGTPKKMKNIWTHSK